VSRASIVGTLDPIADPQEVAMGVLHDEHTIRIDGSAVAVKGRSGPVHATWTLSIDGDEVDQATAAGDFHLRGALPDGTPIEARVHQSLLGPTEVAVLRNGVEMSRASGFVL
jgi:hypothetical protein